MYCLVQKGRLRGFGEMDEKWHKSVILRFGPCKNHKMLYNTSAEKKYARRRGCYEDYQEKRLRSPIRYQ
jgi:hypothetical protein